MKLFSLDGKVAIVTGSTRGIGRAIVEQMALAGAKVVVSSRKPEACDKTLAELKAAGHEAIAVPCNVGYKDQCERLVQTTLDTWGRVDVLVLNAAINPYFGPMQDMSDDVFDKMIATNLKAQLWLCKLVCPQMAERGSGANLPLALRQAGAANSKSLFKLGRRQDRGRTGVAHRDRQHGQCQPGKRDQIVEFAIGERSFAGMPRKVHSTPAVFPALNYRHSLDDACFVEETAAEGGRANIGRLNALERHGPRPEGAAVYVPDRVQLLVLLSVGREQHRNLRFAMEVTQGVLIGTRSLEQVDPPHTRRQGFDAVAHGSTQAATAERA